MKIGSPSFIANSTARSSIEGGLDEKINSLQNDGNTVVLLSLNDRIVALIAVQDTERAEAGQVVERLGKMKKRVGMLSGDNRRAADAVARRLGIDSDLVFAEILPNKKAEVIADIQAHGKHKVAMVGDGLNDASALVRADVGIAMSGIDITSESAQITLMRNDLTAIPTLFQTSKKTMDIIKQNFVWAFVFNLAALPLAITGILPPIIASGSMAISSFAVTLNSQRLKWSS